MHIAICDDNIADRKQLERLLKRQNSNFKEETLYIDSYGDSEALFHFPMLYDLFFIDISTEEESSLQISQKLRNLNVQAPIVLFFAFPKDSPHCEDSFFFLNKPINSQALEDIINKSITLKNNKCPQIELREESGTSNYIKEEDFLYAITNGRYLNITLSNKKVLSVLSTLDNLYSQLNQFPNIFPINNKVIINVRHLQNIRYLSAYMKDGSHFSISPFYLSYTKYALKEFQNEYSSKAY